NAMTLSTINKQGFPKSRVVLLKEFDEKGFIFYSNYKSEKGVSIENNNKVCLSFFWEEHQRQVIIKGYAEKTSLSKSLAYFNSRPKGSKLGALVSNQSSVIDSKKILFDKLIELKDKFSDTNIPMPSNWGGYNVSPIEFEFWQGGNNRLHDRLRFKLVNNNWIKHRLSP
ncbi:MAG: pyridoxamine 5'-phosphate oxidase, partial [Flavobacteriaceae bacterium]|nr:pyridoxamine 5'-phosphate oxidase [Flavobacteriaceae bacterium]